MNPVSAKPKRIRRTKAEVEAEKVKEAERLLAIEKAKANNPVTPSSSPNPSATGDGFAPLPILGGGSPTIPTDGVQAPSTQVPPVSDPNKDALLKQGLIELATQDIPRGLENILILFNLDHRATVNAPSEGRAALWAEFFLPWLRKHFPNFDEEYMMWFLTGSMLASMVSIKRKDKGGANDNQANPS